MSGKGSQVVLEADGVLPTITAIVHTATTTLFTSVKRDDFEVVSGGDFPPRVKGPRKSPRREGASTSTALFAGVPVEDIIKAGAWKTPTTFVQCYLTDTLAQEDSIRACSDGRSEGQVPPFGPPTIVTVLLWCNCCVETGK